MSELTTAKALLERILGITEWLGEAEWMTKHPSFKAWLEEEQQPKLTLEYLQMSGTEISDLRRKKMSLQQLKDSPDGTKMQLQAQVVDVGQMKDGNYGQWGSVKVADASGTHEITYSCGQDNPIYLQVHQVYEFQLRIAHNGQYRNLKGYVKAGSQPQPAQASPPPAQTPADTNQYQAPQGVPAPANYPMQQPQQATIGGQPVVPVASIQPQFQADSKDKQIMTQSALKAYVNLVIAGVIPANTDPEEHVHRYAHILWNVSKGLGNSNDQFRPQPTRQAAIPQDEIPF